MAELINISDIKKAYFIGIGGIGMSALARFFHSRGVAVSGYDKTPTALTEKLVEEGMPVNYVDDASLAPTDADIVVYTPAIPSNNAIIENYRKASVPLLKRSDVLEIISKNTFNICVAGTHGKTTISTMVAYILRDSGYGCTAFLGGISTNYNTNFWSHPNQVCVIEADEYDRSFLKLYPNIISISSMDPDHLDIYGTAEEMEKTFIQFTNNLKENGLLISHKGLKREGDFTAAHHLTYHLNNQTASIKTTSLNIHDGAFVYDVMGEGWMITGLQLNMGGMHNVENSLVAIAIAKHLGIDDEKIRAALSSFKGVRRRFEYVIKTNDMVFIDDYAHHPEELRALITGAKAMYPKKKCTVVFQPHLFTRTRDLVDGFAETLSMADEVLLLPIYPARELPIAGVNSEMIISKMSGNVKLIEKEALIAYLSEATPELLITAGAGDIDKLVEPIKEKLQQIA
jgi:UDP-N-acetylmuramate--alanine ligase